MKKFFEINLCKCDAFTYRLKKYLCKDKLNLFFRCHARDMDRRCCRLFDTYRLRLECVKISMTTDIDDSLWGIYMMQM